MQVAVVSAPAVRDRGRNAEELGDGPVHVLLPYGSAVGADDRHPLHRPGEAGPPGVRQREVVLEDRLIDTHRQLRPVDGGVVGCVVDGQEGGSVAVEVSVACAHHDGNSEEACRLMVAALAGLPGDFRSGLVRRRALDLYEAIPAQHHHERAVKELRDALAA
ncbi:hypothetical protein ACGFY9_36370 [Streptomyces sp. NPDC048504]|uniref:hypothetical protein n=1 Tax=Streptomyces sp. NPDC048504 TaxID=3365559 RepID=UPI0037214917